MFYKFKDCVILETVMSYDNNDTLKEHDIIQYRVLNLKHVLSKADNVVLHDEAVSFFDYERSEVTEKLIKDKNPSLTDKACKHIFELFTNKPILQVYEEQENE